MECKYLWRALSESVRPYKYHDLNLFLILVDILERCNARYPLLFGFMKKIISVGVALTLALSTLAVSAMEMQAGDTMMKKDEAMMMKDGTMTMEKDTMMKKDDAMMMKKDTMMMDSSKLTVQGLAKKMGYNWLKDRKMLAEKAGIQNYRGTKAQNLMIRKYLQNMK